MCLIKQQYSKCTNPGVELYEGAWDLQHYDLYTMWATAEDPYLYFTYIAV